MKISIEDQLTHLKKGLIDSGYEVYNFSESISSDVYIYSESNTGLHNLNNLINPVGEGSLLIDGDGKNLNEIQYILSHRLYSPLFNVTNNKADFV